jgi:hypothetical protein
VSLSRPAWLRLALPANCCRWGVGDLGDASFHWCGRITHDPPYCREHYQKSLRKNEAREPVSEDRRAEARVWLRRAAGA